MAVYFSQKSVTVTPNERQALALWEAHAAEQQAKGLLAWETPSTSSWSEFVRALWDEYQMGGLYSERPLTLMNEWQERFLWLRVVRQSPEGEGLLNLAQASRLACDAWKLTNSYLLEGALKGGSTHWSEDTQVFLRWVAALQAECRRRGWLEPSRLESALVECLDNGHVPQRALPQSLNFRGFAEWTPAQRRLLEALQRAGVTVTEEQRDPPKTLSAWKQVSAVDGVDELRLAAAWLREKLEAHPHHPPRVGLVVPDLAERRAEVQRVLSEVFQPSLTLEHKSLDNLVFDLSAGQKLAGYAVVADALSLLNLWKTEHPLQEWKVLFSSPYLGEADSERYPRSLLWTQLLDEGRFVVDRHRLETLAQPREEEKKAFHCRSLWKLLLHSREAVKEAAGPLTPSDWAEQFAVELEQWGWPGERKLDSVEYQTVARWKKLLAQFGSLDQLLGPVSRGEALSTLARVAEETVYQPKVSTPVLEVMGTLEAVGLKFDYLWLAGFHDGAWPRAASPNPYLPFALQKEREVAHSTPERELEFARRLSAELLSAADRGVVSYPGFAEDQHLRPSPMFSQLEVCPREQLGDSPPNPHRLLLESGATELYADPGPPPVPADAHSKGGTSLFKFQAACPFQAFAALRLDAKPTEEVKEGLDARQRGNLLHHALEMLWKTVRDLKTWQSHTEIERAHILAHCAEQAVSAQRRHRPDVLRGLMFELEVERVTRLLREWMVVEEEREPFCVLATEERVDLQFADLQLRVTIDRVDRLEDGSLAVIDYKTGSPAVKDWEGERPREPQLPLYCVADARPADYIAFARLKPGKMGFMGLGKEDGRIPGVDGSQFAEDSNKDWAQRLADWKATLERLAGDFRDGRAVVDPLDVGTCQRCRMQSLCRVEESKE